MKIEFESIEEVKEFVTKLKGTRGGKADKDDEAGPSAGAAPAPLAPPTAGAGFPGAGGFAAPAAGAAPMGGAFPAAAATGPAPEVLALVTRVNTRIDWAMSPVGGGQPAEQVTQWFRGECQKAGLDAASATLDQIKTVFLPKMTVPMLEGIAKLMNA